MTSNLQRISGTYTVMHAHAQRTYTYGYVYTSMCVLHNYECTYVT